MRGIRYSVQLILALLAVAVLLPFPAYGQVPKEGISLQISPLPIELNTVPGASVNTDLRVRNAGTQPERLQVRLVKVTEDDSGVVHLAEPQASDEWVHWVSFSRQVFDAPPGEWQTIRMTVAVPKSAAFGYYFAVEYMRAADVQPQPGQAVAHGAVATFILLNAEASGAKREAEVVSFTADHQMYEFLPATFTVKIRSTGNVHVAPHGNIFITRGATQVGNIPINAAGGNILPQGSRFFSAGWNDGFPRNEQKTDSNGQPVLTKQGQPAMYLKWDFSKANRLRFGHYTAHLVMVYDNGQRDVPLQASVSFWVIPWRLIGAVIGLLGLLVALIAYIVILRRRLKRLSGRTSARRGLL